MKFNDNLPIYRQIMDKIKLKIINKEYGPGDKLLSARDMAKELKVNPNTVQRAYTELESEDIVFTKRGMGTFVTEDEDLINNMKETMARDIIKEFVISVNALGINKDRVLELIKEEDEKLEKIGGVKND